MHRGARVRSIVVAAVAAVALVVPGGSSVPAQADAQLPNIVPLPASDVRIGRADSGVGLALRFSSWMSNQGNSHFDIVGTPNPNPSLPVTAAASQCTAWAAPRVCSAREQIGSLEYHNAHAHWHFQDFARYELRRVTDGGVVAVSDKVSFCMMDSAPTNNASSRSLDARFGYPLYYGCDLGTQGISAGWSDIYSSDLPGQQLSVTGLADGQYDLVIVADPAGLILETNDSDNSSTRRIVISNGGTKAVATG